MYSEAEIWAAWAAGFFNGEGSTFVTVMNNKTHSPLLRLSISQKDPDVLKTCQQALGAGKVYGPYYSRGRALYHLHITSYSETKAALEKMWPWLSQIKREQANTAVEKYTQLYSAYGRKSPKDLSSLYFNTTTLISA